MKSKLTLALLAALMALVTMPLASASLTFRILSWDGEIDDLHYDEGRESISLAIYEDRLSRRYQHSDSGPLTLYRTLPGEQGPVKQNALSMDIPPGLSQAILLVTRDRQSRIHGTWLNDSFDYTPQGSMRFHNLSRYPVALDLGSTSPIMLPQGSTHLHSIKQDTRSVPLMAATAEVDGEWKLFSTLPVPVNSNRRTLVIIRNATTSDTREVSPVEMRLFHDQLRPTTRSGQGSGQ